MLFSVVESKHKNLYFQFSEKKSFWHMKEKNIPSEKMPGYKHGGVRNSAFMTSQKLNMVELATVVYLVNRMSYKVDL